MPPFLEGFDEPLGAGGGGGGGESLDPPLRVDCSVNTVRPVGRRDVLKKIEKN